MHAAAVDTCASEIDQLMAEANEAGTSVSRTVDTQTIAKACEDAVQQNPTSTTLRLNLANALVWAGRESSALIQLELLMGSDKEIDVLRLATAMCAYGKGSAKVLASTCRWAAESDITDPILAEKAAKQAIHQNQADLGLQLTVHASLAGSASSLQYVQQLCDAYTPHETEPFASLPAELVSLDPIYVAATACEAAFQSTPTDTGPWSTRGFKSAEALTYFDDYGTAAEILLSLAQSNDATIQGDAIDVLDNLCTSTAGDPNDPDLGSEGVSDTDLLPDRAQPVCEAAAYVWPDNGRFHYNLSRVYSQLGPNEEPNAEAAMDEAARLGYELAKSSSGSSPLVFDFNAFNVPPLIRAFYEQDMEMLNRSQLPAFVYAIAVHEVLSQDNVMFLGDNATRILLEVDPNLGFKAQVKLTNSSLMQDAMTAGIESFLAPLMSVVNTRQEGGSIMSEIQGLQQAILASPMVQLENLKAKATQDAQRLAILYSTNPNDFRKVYAGIKRFIEQ